MTPVIPPVPVVQTKVEPVKTTEQIVTNTVEPPKWKAQIDKALETTSISDLKAKLAT